MSAVFIKGSTLLISNFYVSNIYNPFDITISRHACPSNCFLPKGEIETLLLGTHDAVDRVFESDRNFWRYNDFVKGMNKLVEIQNLATPNTVDGPTSVLRIYKDGTLNWLQKGECK
jgi:hypothetical protein